MNFPRHNGSLTLEHNLHKDLYKSIKDYIEELDERECPPEWSNPIMKTLSIELGEIWELRWYPITPIGFEYIAAPTFEDLIAFSEEIIKLRPHTYE